MVGQTPLIPYTAMMSPRSWAWGRGWRSTRGPASMVDSVDTLDHPRSWPHRGDGRSTHTESDMIAGAGRAGGRWRGGGGAAGADGEADDGAHGTDQRGHPEDLVVLDQQ